MTGLAIMAGLIQTSVVGLLNWRVLHICLSTPMNEKSMQSPPEIGGALFSRTKMIETTKLGHTAEEIMKNVNL